MKCGAFIAALVAAALIVWMGAQPSRGELSSSSAATQPAVSPAFPKSVPGKVVGGQLISFSHEHHVRGLGIDCQYCHARATSTTADVPAAKVCFNCHSPTSAQVSLIELTTAPSVAVHSAAPADAPKFAPGGKTVVIELEGEINDLNRDQLFRRFAKARELGAKNVILDLDTYGGLVTSGLEISRFLKRQNDLHVVAFVKDKAISAGAMIAMSCDEIVMSRSATLGDCAPIVFNFDGKLEDLPAAERAKQESPILADFEESARRNHHDLLLARAMVAVQLSVYWVQSPTGERRFVDKDEYKTLTAAGWKDVPGAPVPVDSDSTLLTVGSDQAILYGLASGQANSAEALASERGYDVAATFKTSEGDKLVTWLTSWPVRFLLIIIFLSCANVVIHAPGHGVAEVVGLGALLLMLGVPLLTGYAQWWEILMIFAGLGLIAVEILLPGHMVPGLVGGAMVLFGLVMTFVPKEPTGMPGFLPNMHSTWAAFQHGLTVVAAALGCSLFIWFWMNRFLPKVPYFNRLILNNISGGVSAATLNPLSTPAETSWPPIGSIGRSITELKPGGSAEFYDESVADKRVASVVSDSGFVPPGIKLVVREVSGNRVVVRPV